MNIIMIQDHQIAPFLPLLPEQFDPENSSGQILLGAVNDDNEACAILWANISNLSCEILSLFVAEDYRRMGIATALLDTLVEQLKQNRIVIPVTCVFHSYEEEESLYRLFDSRTDFDLFPYGSIYHATPADIENSELCQKLSEKAKECHLFTNVPRNSQVRFLKKLQRISTNYLSPKDPLVKELCYCSMRRGRITSAGFVIQKDEKTLELLYLYAEPRHALSLARTLGMIIKQCHELYPEATVEICPTTEVATNITLKLFGSQILSTPLIQAQWNYQ